jgi:uncharacterized OB-fold protein
LAEATAEAPSKRPLVDYLVLPENGEPYLQGSTCPNCGQNYVGARRFCSKCNYGGEFKEIKLSDQGELHVWTIIHQSAPGIPVPYIAGIIDLPEGVSVRSNIEGIEPKPENLSFGMKVKMYTEQTGSDREGNAIIAYKFKPV